MAKMAQLHALMVEIVCSEMSDDQAIELMVDEGLPRQVCPQFLQEFKDRVSNELESIE